MVAVWLLSPGRDLVFAAEIGNVEKEIASVDRRSIFLKNVAKVRKTAPNDGRKMIFLIVNMATTAINRRTKENTDVIGMTEMKEIGAETTIIAEILKTVMIAETPTIAN